MNNEFIHKEFFKMLVGKKLGRGQGREVFVLRSDPSLVVKIEETGESFQNIREWEYWKEMQGTPIEKYLAPCLYISSCGSVMIQERVSFPEHDKYPEKLPAFFTDTKYENFGIMKGKFVCCDYGNIPFAKGVSTKMKKVDWWSDKQID